RIETREGEVGGSFTTGVVDDGAGHAEDGSRRVLLVVLHFRAGVVEPSVDVERAVAPLRADVGRVLRADQVAENVAVREIHRKRGVAGELDVVHRVVGTDSAVRVV